MSAHTRLRTHWKQMAFAARATIILSLLELCVRICSVANIIGAETLTYWQGVAVISLRYELESNRS